MPRKRYPWYRRFPEDFRRDTRHLSLDARGAYGDIIDLMYELDGPIPDDERWIANQLNIGVLKWRHVRKELDASGMLPTCAGGITNRRAEKVIAERKDKDRQREPGRKAPNGTAGSAPAAGVSGAAAGAAADTHRGTDSGVDNDPPGAAAKEGVDQVESGVKNGLPEGISDGVCQNQIPGGMSRGISRGMTEGMSGGLSKNKQQNQRYRFRRLARARARLQISERSSSKQGTLWGHVRAAAAAAQEGLPSKAEISAQLGRLMRVASHLLIHPDRADVRVLPAWIAEGCDFDRDIIATIEKIAERPKPPKVGCLSYFTPAIMDAKEARESGATSAQQQSRAEGATRSTREIPWERYLEHYAETEVWVEAVLGPPPHQPGCKAPPNLVAQYCPHLAPAEAA